MQAIILAAGEGSRLRPLTQNCPKALLPVAGKPILGHVISSLHAAGVRDIIVVVGYRSEMVMKYLSSFDDISVVHQKNQLGTADAVAAALPLVTDDLLILPGDNYISSASIRALMQHKNAILVTRSKESARYGVLTLKDNYILSIQEKPKHVTSMLISCGAYRIAQSLCASIPSYGYNMTDFFDAIISHVPFAAVHTDEWGDAIWPWHLLGLNDSLLLHTPALKHGKISSHAIIEGLVFIGKGATIGPYTHIKGPTYIGEDVTLPSHVVIGPGCSIGARSYIGAFTTLSHSLLMEDVTILEQGYIADSVIGERSHIHAATKLVPSEGVMKMAQGDLIESSFGAIIGSDTIIGAGSMISHAIIGNGADIGMDTRICSAQISDNMQVC
ncbi:MAG: NTP transferase domain-containing protein [Methanomicrobiales archaeon]|jgi:glucose-1-phosphate thymidylyltransferase|nr:NTP transferase domain-containing protein [Methanomicrobiales archaeon]